MNVETPRLCAIAGLLPRCGTVADIGCDHGKLACLLLVRGVCERVIAVDISPHSVEKTKRLGAALGLTARLDVRLGDGFSALRPDEAQAAVLAGLGGELIAAMLPGAGERTLVLQPMQQADVLRRALRTGGYAVTAEAMVEENRRIHELMRVERGAYCLPGDLPEPLWDEVGPLLWERREPLLAQRLRKKAGAVQKRAQEARRAGERGRLAAQRLEEQIALLLWAAEKIEGEQLPRSGGERKAGPCI